MAVPLVFRVCDTVVFAGFYLASGLQASKTMKPAIERQQMLDFSRIRQHVKTRKSSAEIAQNIEPTQSKRNCEQAHIP